MPKKKTALPVNPILIGTLPRAETAALQSFERLPANWYQNSTIGKWQNQEEGTACDCVYVHGRSALHDACGDASGCINRLTLTECDGDCPSGKHCQNQRFQRKQYTDIAIVQTEKKGFGLRAEANIDQDDFIWEYVGEIVKESEFIKRMGRYAQEGIKHFYFMMLQKEQFIDATKKGDIGRFANHSCNPNCYVSKWYVGSHVRMGIFAKRAIFKDEELTFNYNVDRYGHDAQECYCGEENCVGFIGGKTQTDIGGMDDLYIEALGITEDVEKYSLRGTRRKKGKKLDEDYLPPIKPLVLEEELPTLLQALRQASQSNTKMLPRLLARLSLTTDPEVMRGALRLRGLSLLSTLLRDHGHEPEVVKLILSSLPKWPILSRNKLEDSKIEESLQGFVQQNSDPEIVQLAEINLNNWSVLESVYRIPRRPPEEANKVPPVVATMEREWKKIRLQQEVEVAFKFKASNPTRMKEESATVDNKTPLSPAKPVFKPPTSSELLEIIQRAKLANQEALAEREAKLAEEQKALREKAIKKEQWARKEKEKRERRQKEKERAKNGDKDATKAKVKASSSKADSMSSAIDKRLLRLVGELVVKHLSRYKDRLDHEGFKQHAKKLTHVIAEKEAVAIGSGSIPQALSDKQTAKMKRFCHDYCKKKILREKGTAKDGDASATTLEVLPSGAILKESMDQNRPGDGGEAESEDDDSDSAVSMATNSTVSNPNDQDVFFSRPFQPGNGRDSPAA